MLIAWGGRFSAVHFGMLNPRIGAVFGAFLAGKARQMAICCFA
jgi:hypothetical protein